MAVVFEFPIPPVSDPRATPSRSQRRRRRRRSLSLALSTLPPAYLLPPADCRRRVATLQCQLHIADLPNPSQLLANTRVISPDRGEARSPPPTARLPSREYNLRIFELTASPLITRTQDPPRLARGVRGIAGKIATTRE